jgi:FHA domain
LDEAEQKRRLHAELLADLIHLRQEAGQPSLGTLVRRSDNKITKSTLNDHLSGRRSNLPSWRFVAALVQACHAEAASTGLQPDSLGTPDEWRLRWLAAMRGDPENYNSFRNRTQAISGDTFRRLLKAHEASLKNSGPPATTDSFDPYVTTASAQPDLRNRSNKSCVLVMRNSKLSGTRYEINSVPATIGRAEDNTVILDDDSVSRRHAAITRKGTRFSVRDLGSLNGTYLEQEMISTEMALKSNQELQIGIYRLLFIQGNQRTN